MSRTPPRRADEHLRWLKLVIAENNPDPSMSPSRRAERGIGPLPPLGALTGTDFAALEAIDRCWALLGYVEAETVLVAVAALAKEMQESTRPFARVLIARYRDWGDMDRYWPQVQARLKPRAPAPSIVDLAVERIRLVAAAPLALFVLLLAGCNGVPPPNIEGAPCTATTATYKEIACGLRLDTSLHTRCVVECKRDLGRWVVQTCLPECGTGGFYAGEPGETGECYLPTVPCAAVDGGAR